MSSDTQTLQVDVARSSDQVEVELTRGKKRKQKKRKRDESGSSFTYIEPPRKHPLLPSSQPHQVPTPVQPIARTSLPQRADTRTPLTPMTPINTSLSLLAPFQPICSWPKGTFFGSKLFATKNKTPALLHTDEACDISSRSDSDTESINPRKIPPRSHTPSLNALHRHSADKDRIIRDLQQRVAEKEDGLVKAKDRITELEQEGENADAGYERLRADRDRERLARKEAEAKLKQALLEKGDLDEKMKRLKGESRTQALLLAQADEEVVNASRQVRTAVDRGGRWMVRAEGFEVQLKKAKALVEVERQKVAEVHDNLASNTLFEEPSQLRRNLLLAKTDLAKERLNNQELRSQLETERALVCTRDATITFLRDQFERDQVSSKARIATLDEECEKQLAELETQLNTVSKLTAENNDLQAVVTSRDERIRVLECQVSQSHANLEASTDRAEWYKAEYKRRDIQAKHWEDQYRQERRTTNDWKAQAVNSGRNAVDTIGAHRALVEASQLITKLDGDLKRASGRELDLRGEIKRKEVVMQGMLANERYRKDQWDGLHRKCQTAEGEVQKQRNRMAELEAELTRTSAALWAARLGGKEGAEGEASTTICDGEGNMQVKEEDQGVGIPDLKSRLGDFLVEVDV